jgi:CRISPR-associated protein Cas7/Csd2, subtype I-C/DVULG
MPATKQTPDTNTPSPGTPIAHRYDFVYFFDVTDGNPNGDPDAGNLPRIDPETGHGLVTDVCLKRKIRNFVGTLHNGAPPHEIYVREKAVLNNQHERAYLALGVDPKEFKKVRKDKSDTDEQLTAWMCKNFFDIRTFGAVMSTQINCGQVRGPVQFSFARSLDPVVTLEHSVTRCAVTTDGEAQAQSGDNRTMGRKFTIPYGLYRVHGYISPHLADPERRGTGFSTDDLDLLKQALNQMFEIDRAAARGQMVARHCVAFRHENPFGNAPAHKLFRRIDYARRPQQNGQDAPPRSFEDYELRFDRDNFPAGVTIEEWVTP